MWGAFKLERMQPRQCLVPIITWETVTEMVLRGGSLAFGRSSLGVAQAGSDCYLRPSRVSISDHLISAEIKRFTAAVMNQWGPVLPPLRTLTSTFMGRDQLGLLLQPLGDGEGGVEGQQEEEETAFDGVWQTSVRRKRVTKMRKHKWRKKRRLARQSSARK
ncbi:unnamed protein product [Ascophyllum nodosum]